MLEPKWLRTRSLRNGMTVFFFFFFFFSRYPTLEQGFNVMRIRCGKASDPIRVAGAGSNEQTPGVDGVRDSGLAKVGDSTRLNQTGCLSQNGYGRARYVTA
uniref:Uncharacterized protein n=1 Tax=Prorocentrum micans TaxID=2945 RepID=A0A7S2TER8_PROMC|mmetsp:Transcript_6416/g.5168  ORF Transcript_6416/g.5168 Transcript_6416/m.5168 type:complete len:101 (+) Transcript_6416:199-501(+)